MSIDAQGGAAASGGASGGKSGGQPAALRRRMERFARIRSAHRALPPAVADLRGVEEREARAKAIRGQLMELAQAAKASGVMPGAGAFATVDRELDAMERDSLAQFDSIEFSALRAAIPRAAELNPKEVIALLEMLLLDRENLERRLLRVEYVITILSTDELDGRRNISRDPVALTPLLADFPVEGLDPKAADAIAVELYQVASLDADRENPLDLLRSIRERKEAIGLGCLSPNVLRAVVTYNSRMFNRVETATEESRHDDSSLDELMEEAAAALEDEPEVAEPDPLEVAAPEPAAPEVDASGVDASESVLRDAARVERPRLKLVAKAETDSVLEARSLEPIVAAIRRRITGEPVGRRGPAERVALLVDVSTLETVERDAFLAEEPDADQALLVRTATVGLILRDFGVVSPHLEELGIAESDLTGRWVAELHERFGQLVSRHVASGKDFELASLLSGIKTKHLLAPMKARRGGKRRMSSLDMVGEDVAAAEMRRVGREAVDDSESGGVRRRMAAGRQRAMTLWPTGKRLFAVVALVPFIVVGAFAAVNYINANGSTVSEVDTLDLSEMSPYISSAYRSQNGRGGLVIGRLHPSFMRLSLEGKLEAAAEMEPRFIEMGASTVMLYDRTGVLEVHYVGGVFRNPHKPVVREGALQDRVENTETSKRLRSGYAWRTDGGQGAAADGTDTESAGAPEDDDPWSLDDDEDSSGDDDW